MGSERASKKTSGTQESRSGKNNAIFAWRQWATRHRLSAALLAGIVSVHVGSVIGFWLGGFGLTRLDWNTANGLVYLPDAAPLPQFLFGNLYHYLDGAFFAVIYAVALAPLLPIRSTILGNLFKALLFGTGLAIVALLILTPLIYAPASGAEAGFFSLNFGWSYVLSVFIFHWVYGLHLGLIYNPLDDDDADSQPISW